MLYCKTSTFIRKHWLGQYSLIRSFWLNTILLAWFTPLVALTLLSSNTWHVRPRVTSVAFVVIFLTVFPLLLWGMGGTARAGKLYREKGGRKIWPMAAMLATMLLLIDSFYFFLGTRGILIEHVRMGFTGKYGPPASVSVIKNGTELQLAGTQQDGPAEGFAVAINNAPFVTAIALDSKGGLLQEATLLAKSISQHGLDTYVGRECSSACTFVFLAGRHRCLAQGARIGFHAASYMHDLSRRTFENIATFQRDQYLKAGLAEPFVSEIMETPNSRVWYPSRKELLEARVTTQDCP